MTATDRSLLRGGAVWVGILLAANANGALREFVLRPSLGPRVAPVVSTLLLCGLILLLARLSVGWIAPAGPPAAWRVGILWLVLTLAFEFLAGRYLFGDTWERLLSDYDVTAGRLWILVPITTLIAPRWAWGRLARDNSSVRAAGLALAVLASGTACDRRAQRDPTPDASSTETASADSMTWVVRLDGAGPIRYGMSVADAAGQYLVLAPGEGGDSLRLVFETDGRLVTRYRTGLLPAAEYVEGCG